MSECHVVIQTVEKGGGKLCDNFCLFTLRTHLLFLFITYLLLLLHLTLGVRVSEIDYGSNFDYRSKCGCSKRELNTISHEHIHTHINTKRAYNSPSYPVSNPFSLLSSAKRRNILLSIAIPRKKTSALCTHGDWRGVVIALFTICQTSYKVHLQIPSSLTCSSHHSPPFDAIFSPQSAQIRSVCIDCQQP